MHPERELDRRRKARRRVAWALALTFVAHGLFALLLAVSSALWPAPPPQPAPQPVALRQLTSDEWDRNRRVEGPESAGAATEPEEKEPEPTPEGQVVDVAPGNRQESKDARFLAPTANSVEKETRAREQSAFYRNAMPRRTRQGKQDHQGADPVDQLMAGGNGGRAADQAPSSGEGPQRAAVELPSMRRREEIRLRDEGGPGPGAVVANRSASEDLQGNSDRLLLRPGQESGGEHASRGTLGPPGLANLVPSPGALDAIAGAAPNDHLEDVEEGDGTFLNTREWKYSGFFNRVKQSVGVQWNPNSVLRTRDPTGRIYGGRDRFTLVHVTLDDQGGLKDISVQRSCGVDFLDLEAVHSFERAQPFPNPPPGLLQADSTVRFEFGFFIDMSTGPKLRLFRRAN